MGKKDSKKGVLTVTSDEEYVRMQIFEGQLPDTEGYKALWELEKAKNETLQKEIGAARRTLHMTLEENAIEWDRLSKRGLWERLKAWFDGTP